MNEDGKFIRIFPVLNGCDLSVEDMDLEVSVRNALKRRGIHTLAQLLQLNHAELVRLFPNRKLRSCEDVIHCLVCLSEEAMDIAGPAFESVEDISDMLGGFNMPDKKFNIFQVAGIYKSEEIHTSVIAELINPRSTFHDKGANFLDKFLQEIGAGKLPVDELARAEVKTEVPTNKGRRIDMTISVGKFYMPFEVKIWAGDQDAQLQDYYEFAEEQAKNLEKKVPKIYYLTPDGHGPSMRSCGEQSNVPVQLLSFNKHILFWLKACMNDPNIRPIPSDVLEIMKQLRDNIQGGVRPGIQGFSKWNGEEHVLDTIYEKLSQKYVLSWTECTADYMTFTLNKLEFEGTFLEFALRIKKVSKDTVRLYLICGIAGKDTKLDYAGAGDYILQNGGNFQILLENTFEDDFKLKIKSTKSAWSRLPEIACDELDAELCIVEVENIFQALLPVVRQIIERN